MFQWNQRMSVGQNPRELPIENPAGSKKTHAPDYLDDFINRAKMNLMCCEIRRYKRVICNYFTILSKFSSIFRVKIPKQSHNSKFFQNIFHITLNLFHSFEQAIMLQVRKLSQFAIPPTRASPVAAGYDLYAAYDGKVPARGKALIKTDIAIAIPPNTYGRVAPRSGLAWKHSIDVGAGVIDEDYRGNVGVILFNHSDEDFTISHGDRIAQLIIERIMHPEVVLVEELSETLRGEGGFGSTGFHLQKESSGVSVEESKAPLS